MSFGVVSGVGLGIGVWDFGGDRRREGAVWGWIQCRNGVLIDYRLVCEKLTIFPYAECIVEFCDRLVFLWYSQVQDRSGVEEKFMCKNVTKQTQHLHYDRSDNAALLGGHMYDPDLAVNMLGLCNPSNLLFVLSAEEWRALLKLLWGLVILFNKHVGNNSIKCTRQYLNRLSLFYLHSASVHDM